MPLRVCLGFFFSFFSSANLVITITEEHLGGLTSNFQKLLKGASRRTLLKFGVIGSKMADSWEVKRSNYANWGYISPWLGNTGRDLLQTSRHCLKGIDGGFYRNSASSDQRWLTYGRSRGQISHISPMTIECHNRFTPNFQRMLERVSWGIILNFSAIRSKMADTWGLGVKFFTLWL